MKLMLDANIIIDHIGKREPFYPLSRKVCLLGLIGECELFITTNMVTDILYLLRKDYGSLEAQRMFAEDLSFLKQVSVTPEDINEAFSCKWNDFEDCLIACCAKKTNIDFIVTRNTKDFKRSTIKAVSPEELFEELEKRGLIYEEVEFL